MTGKENRAIQEAPDSRSPWITEDRRHQRSPATLGVQPCGAGLPRTMRRPRAVVERVCGAPVALRAKSLIEDRGRRERRSWSKGADPTRRLAASRRPGRSPGLGCPARGLLGRPLVLGDVLVDVLDLVEAVRD